MHRAAKDTGKYQHFLHEPFANSALEHNVLFTLNTAVFYTLLCCIVRVFWSFVQDCVGWRGVCVFGNGRETLPVQPEKLSYYGICLLCFNVRCHLKKE